MIRQSVALLAVAVGSVIVGCKSEPPPRVAVPPAGTYGAPRYDPAKPLPDQIPQSAPPSAPAGQPGSYMTPAPAQYESAYVPTPQPPVMSQPGYDPRIAAPPANQIYQPPAPAPGSYNDVPIVRDQPPEQRAFVEAYNRVGRPKMAIYLNRNLGGQIIEAGDGSTASTPLPAAGGQPYVKPATADEAWAKNLDYEAMENILTDWLAAGGQTEVISPTLARAKLTQEQIQALDKGERGTLKDITERLDADILILVQARPTRQTSGGLSIRLVGESLNTRGGRSIGRAVVDVPPPLEKTTLNEYTRFVARKLMDDMIGSWAYAASSSTPQPAAAPPVQTPAMVPPASTPAPSAPAAPTPPGSIAPPSTVLPPR